MENLIGLVTILLAIGLPLSMPIVYLALNYRKRRPLMELHHAERMAAIARGMELPPLPIELIAGRGPATPSRLLTGLIWLFVGLAVLIALYFSPVLDEFA